RAVCSATAQRPGPVHIDVPISVADTRVTVKRRRVSPTARTLPLAKDLHDAKIWLSEARRPVALIGLDTLSDGSCQAVRDFLERFNVPFVTTYKAKGILPEDHPLCLGAAGLSPLADSHLMPLFAKSDLILCLGYDPIEMRPGWREAWDPATQRVIDIAAVPNDHYMHQAGINIVAPTGPALEALGDGLVPNDTWEGKEPLETRAALADAFPVSEEWGPAAVIAETRAVLPPETLATVDSGAHRILLSQMWRCTEPRGLIQSTGLCTMGCALPMALGLKPPAPDR
ncbi:thiamine pyrophosphate-dependent enzyme, partial [Cribrihabitans sp. XS_ASV171]